MRRACHQARAARDQYVSSVFVGIFFSADILLVFPGPLHWELSAQMTCIERMLQVNLRNTQMAPHTGAHWTEAPPVNRREAREQLRHSRMEDVD